ncbi:MAG: response regulator [Burkholderiales bacterium]|nr:response regulator [Burkholderiales bacterium]
MKLRVALLGFSDFERGALASYFRLASHREPSYVFEPMLTEADYLVADADHLPSVQLVEAIERMDEAIFIGHLPPAGAMAWMSRPIDPLKVLRELDSMVERAGRAEAASDDDGDAEDDLAISLKPEPQPIDRPPQPSRPPLPSGLTQSDPPPHGGAPPAARAPQSAAVEAAPPSSSLLMPSAPAAVPVPAVQRVLIVDDSPIAQRFLETRLKPWGLRVDRVSTSGQALEMLGRRSYDYVFLDLELGEASELDGLALCQQIKRMPNAVSTLVIMVTVHQSELDRVRGALAGCDAYLGKPLDEIELARLLRRQGLKVPPKLQAGMSAV